MALQGVDVQAVDAGAFNYREKILVEVSQKEGQDQWIRPEGGVVNQAGPFTFAIAPLHDRYIDLTRTYLETRVRVVKSDGSWLEPGKDIVAPINLLGACMWERVDVQLNGNPFPGATAINAGIKAYMETMMSYDTDSANTHLHTQFYYPDKPGVMEQMSISEKAMRGAMVSAIKKGTAENVPAVPDYLAPDTDSADYKSLMKVRPDYHDAEAGLLMPPWARDMNRAGVTSGQRLKQARAQEALDRTRLEERKTWVDTETQADRPDDPVLAAAPAGEEETAEARRARLESNDAERALFHIALQRYYRRRMEMEQAYDQEHAPSERGKRLLRREMYRQYINTEIAGKSPFEMATDRAMLNTGFDDRHRISSGSASFDMLAPISHDVFKMSNHLAPGNRLEVRLTMYPHAFLLNHEGDRDRYRLQILDMRLHFHTILLRDRVQPPIKETYLLTETTVNKQIIPGNVPNTTFRIHNGGVMPKNLIFGMTYVEAGDGDYGFNPWNFRHFNIKRLELTVSGETFPTGGLEFDFENENPLVARPYKWLYDNTGASSGEKGNIITWQAYQGGTFLVPFDLTPDKCNGVHQHNAQVGFIDVVLNFAEQLPAPIYVYYYKGTPKVLVNDRATGQMASFDIGLG